MIKASRTDRGEVVSLLCDAFRDITIDNSINFVVGWSPGREVRLQGLMEYLFDKTLIKGSIYLSDNRKCCLLVEYSNHNIPLLAFLSIHFRLLVKTIGTKNLIKVIRREIVLGKQHPKMPHIHPIIMGSIKSSQGKGLGVRLGNEVLSSYRGSKLPIIIETTDNSNVRLYEYFGFSVFKKTEALGYSLIFLKKEPIC